MRKIGLLIIVSFVVSFCNAETEPAANYAGGDGTKANPYQISNLAQLRKLSETSGDWSKYFELTADIDADDTHTWNLFSGKAMGFSPIGNTSVKFTGGFNGNGYAINNLYIDRPTTKYSGMFGYISGAEVENIGLASCDISVGGFSGGLAGYTYQAVIRRCYVTGKVKSTEEIIGGLVGNLTKNSTIAMSYSSCIVSGSVSIGGLVGIILYSNVIDCYVTGNATTSYGLAGDIQNGTVENCYVTNKEAFTGVVLNSSISNCYYDSIRTNGKLDYSTIIGITALNTNDFSEESNFTDWNFTTIWHIDSLAELDTVSRPYLRWQLDNHIVEFKLGAGGDTLIGDTIQYLLPGENSSEITALAKNGYNFKEWQDSKGNVVSANNPIILTNITEDTILYAVFGLGTSLFETAAETTEIFITPNPTAGIVQIPLPSDVDKASLLVYSITGNLVYSNKNCEGGAVDLSFLQKGIYIVKMDVNGNISQVKLVKE